MSYVSIYAFTHIYIYIYMYVVLAGYRDIDSHKDGYGKDDLGHSGGDVIGGKPIF